MTNAIVRTWSATATSTGADDYTRYFAGTLLPQLRALPGFIGAYLLRRELDARAAAKAGTAEGAAAEGAAATVAGTATEAGDASEGNAELTAHTFWESQAAIRAFAGNDVTVAVVEPEAQAMLLDFDRTAAHRSVVVDAHD